MVSMLTTTKSDKYLEMINVAQRIPSESAKRLAQFATRKEAERAARSIGWSTVDATRVDIMGFYVWVITDPHGNAVTHDGLAAWRRA
jgi:hypothetical protein